MSLKTLFSPDSISGRDLFLVWVTAIFLVCLVIANLIGSLLFSFDMPFALPFLGGQTALLSAGIIPFPVTFLLTDLLNEFYGKKTARFVTLIGFMASILVFVMLWVGEHLPVDPRSPMTATQFHHFSGLYTQVFVASLTAYLVGQLLDIQIFHVFRQWTQNKYLWLRAQGSTVISQLFDSILVIFLAFWGQLSVGSLWQLAISNYCWKFIIVVLITPFLYLGQAIFRKYLTE